MVRFIFNSYYLDNVSLPAKYNLSLKTLSDLKRALAGLGPGEVATDHLRASSKASISTFSMPSSLSLALVVSTFLEAWRWKHGDLVLNAGWGEIFSISSQLPSLQPRVGRLAGALSVLVKFSSKAAHARTGMICAPVSLLKTHISRGEKKVSLKSLETATVGWNLVPGALRQILGYPVGSKLTLGRSCKMGITTPIFFRAHHTVIS